MPYCPVAQRKPWYLFVYPHYLYNLILLCPRQPITNLVEGSFLHSSLWPELLIVMEAISPLQRNVKMKCFCWESDCSRAGLSRFFLKAIFVMMVLTLGWSWDEVSLASPRSRPAWAKGSAQLLALIYCHPAPFLLGLGLVVNPAVLGYWLDLMILKAFSNFNLSFSNLP